MLTLQVYTCLHIINPSPSSSLSLNALFMQKEPGGTDFTDFQIKGGQSEGYITSDNGNMGLYVHMDNEEQGGWKVKITADQNLWDKFRITSADFPITPDVC